MKELLYDVKLTQLSSNHSRVRTKEIEGYLSTVPTEGEKFVLNGLPLEEGKSIRILTTSTVESVKKEGNTYYFETQNSSYKLEV